MSYKLYHYYEASTGPFRNLSVLSPEEAQKVSRRIREEGTAFAGRRPPDYLEIRRELEGKARELFVRKGGKPRGPFPHYMTLGACDWLKTWYKRPAWIAIDWDAFDEKTISFAYGDLFPTMRVQDGKSYRRQIYTKREIVEVIREFGWPQEWNRDGDRGPERYIEAQVWDDEAIRPFF